MSWRIVVNLFVVSTAVDWVPLWDAYLQCISNGEFIDMWANFNAEILPPCVQVCDEHAGVALSYSSFCGRSVDYQIESQTEFAVTWSCSSINDVNTPGCEWSDAETADLSLNTYLSILGVLIAQSLQLPPSDVHCAGILVETPSGSDSILGLFQLRVDESFYTTIADESFPFLNTSPVATSGGYDIFMACRIDTYRLLQSSIVTPLTSALDALPFALMGPIRYNVNSVRHLSGISDSDYSFKYELESVGWNSPTVPSTTPTTTTTTISTTTVTTASSVVTTSTLPSTTTTVSTSTSSPESGQSASSAEDVSQRNRILIAVFATAGAIVIVYLTLLFVMRKQRWRSQIRHSDSPYVHSPVRSISHDEPEPALSSVSPEPPVEAHAREFKQRSFKRERESARVGTILEPPEIADEFEIEDLLRATLDKNTDEEKKQIFNDLLLKWHPDKRHFDPKLSTRVFQFIQSRKNWYFYT